MKRFYYILVCLLFPISSLFALENLDELEVRDTRRSVNTFYSGEDAATYVWQPQTVIYQDTSTNHEMWLWSQSSSHTMGPRYGNGWEYNWQPWSADGKRFAFFQDEDVGCYTRGSGASPWFSARSDGSSWRPMCETVGRTAHNASRLYPDWSPIVPDVAYATGANTNGNTGLDQNAIYREVFTDTSITSTLIVDMISGDTSTSRWGGLKDRITGDGLYLLEGNYLEDEPYYVVQVEPSGSRQLVEIWDLPTLDTYWWSTVNPADGHSHDGGVTGNSAHGWVYYFMPTSASVWWRIHLTGSDGGDPNHIEDHTSTYTWWNSDGHGWDEMPVDANKEVQAVGDEYGNTYGNLPAFASDAWWSHSAFDRWGTHVVYSDVEASPIGPACMDIGSYTRTGYNSNPGGNQYSSYTGWSDYFVGSGGTGGTGASVMVSTKYNSTTAGDHITVGETHSSLSGDFCNPGQSPDGTKMVLKSDWLNHSSEVGNLFIGVVYFPYPPEITSCSATGGTVTTQFDWRHDQASPRTYTTRGWPDEDADAPCPPRETEKFRLWRSADKSTWAPLTTTNAEIFTRYDFSDGTWGGNSYWIITDTPGDGTWYYIVTSVEWSGLESRALSNIYSIMVSSGSGTGSQDTAYPSSPGDLDNISASDFYTSYSSENASKLTRYYNIYAEDGSSPSISQTNRIASISYNACSGGDCSWVDWLGNTGGTTQFVVTAVDTQGNESTALSVTSTHQKSPATAIGQYTIEWDNIVESGGTGTSMSIGGSQTITLGGSQTLTIQ